MNHEEAAHTLGMTPEELSIIANSSKSRLKHLGNPAQNAPKFYAAVDIFGLAQDTEWLHQATETVRKARLAKRTRMVGKSKSADPGVEDDAHQGAAV